MKRTTLTQHGSSTKGLKRRPRTTAAIVAILLGAIACGTGPAISPDVKKMLGKDDGFALAVFYGAELMGSVDGCGCFGNAKAGGPPYRFGYEDAFRSVYGDAGVLSVDAGDWSASVRDGGGAIVDDLVVQDEWVVKVLDRFGLDAANITARDADFFAGRYMRAGARDAAVAEHPAAARFVSANLRPLRDDLLAPPAYVVREVTGGRLPGGKLRVAIAGVTEDAPAARQAGFEVADPGAALAQALPKARGESDLVVVLAYLPPDRVAALARDLGPLVDLFVVAHPTARERAPEIGGESRGARIAYARYRTQQLGELRVRFADGERKIAEMTNRYVPLDEPTPRHPDAERLAAEARDAVKSARARRFERGQ
jgi:hypothetical protein